MRYWAEQDERKLLRGPLDSEMDIDSDITKRDFVITIIVYSHTLHGAGRGPDASLSTHRRGLKEIA